MYKSKIWILQPKQLKNTLKHSNLSLRFLKLNLIKSCDINKKLNELYKSINTDLTKFKIEMKKYVDGGSVKETSGEELLDSKIDNKPPFLMTRSGHLQKTF